MAKNQLSKVIQRLRQVVVQSGAGMTDSRLLDLYVRQKDDAALAGLIRRHGPMVWGVCHRILRNHHDAEDAFQATFLVLVRKVATIRQKELVANWLYGVARQTAIRAKVATFKRVMRERQVTEMPEREAVQPKFQDDLELLLDQELNRLPQKYRVLIILRDLEGRTHKEVAQQLGRPEGTVAGQLARARAMLAKRLSRRGLVVSGSTLGAALSAQVGSASTPAMVVSSTIQAATLFATGQAAAPNMISAKVVALTEGVIKAMLLTKLKIASGAVLVAVVLAGIGASMASPFMAVTEEQRGGGQGKAKGEAKEKAKDGEDRKVTIPSLEVMGVVVAAWEQAGAEFGWLRVDDSTGTGTGRPFVPAKPNPAVPPQGDLPSGAEDTARGYYAAVHFRVFPGEKLRTLPMREQCHRIWVEDPNLTDDDLVELAQLKHLQWLVIRGSKLTDAGLKHLAGLQGIQRLNVSYDKSITGAGIKEFANLANLQSLNLAGTGVTDQGLKEVARLKKLQHLNVQRTAVTDSGLKELVGLKNLSTLYVGTNQVTDKGLVALAELTALRWLSLDGTGISDTGLKQLAGLKNLRFLDLRRAKVTEAGVKELRASLPECKMSVSFETP